MVISKILNKLLLLLKNYRYYFIFIFIIILFSYGQMLFMYVWKDDNAIFFKFNHLDEIAGYLGRGLFGEGPYRFSVTPYYFIYRLFGYEVIYPYYVLTLIFYFFTSLAVYKLFSVLISEEAGKLAGFLFACGYIASEGFLWLASSMIQSVSIILTSLTLVSYYFFLTKKNSNLFLISLFLFFATIYITPVRTHYLFFLILVFECIWLIRNINLKGVLLFLARSSALLLVFYRFYLESADSRTFLFWNFLEGLLKGQFYKLYSTLGSLGNLFLPDPQIQFVANLLGDYTKSHHALFIFEVAIILITSFILKQIFRGKKYLNRLTLLLVLFGFVVLYLAYQISISPQIKINTAESLAFFIGGFFLTVMVFLTIFNQGKIRLWLIFNLIWLILNLLVYSTYLPTNLYASIDRYLAHSFIPLVGILSLSLLIKEERLKKLVVTLVIIWGVINVINSVKYQNSILINRSFPAREFYTQLKNYLPNIRKGDLFYFDVSGNSIRSFESAFSVGQMPVETAIAWRYGVDRYDIKMFTDFDKFIEEIKSNNVALDKIYTFYYSKEGLINTTNEFTNGLVSNSLQAIKVIPDLPIQINSAHELILDLKEPITSIVPVEVYITMSAKVIEANKLTFPILSNQFNEFNSIFKDKNLRALAYEYQNYKLNFANKTKIRVTSEWTDRVLKNISDLDEDTVWQSDRVGWQKGQEEITVDLTDSEEIDRLVWINGFPNNTPIEYSVYVSNNGSDWNKVKSIISNIRINDKLPQIIEFPKQRARFLKMQINKTLGDDSPAISEILVLPARFSNLNILEAENFLVNPYAFIPNKELYNATLDANNYKGEAKLFWISDKFPDWYTINDAKFQITYDGSSYTYKIIIPPGGTSIKKIKIGNFQIPGEVTLLDLNVKYTLVNK